ncbi:MAG: D-glycerate dehydrogenase [Anaerolineae bacterium]|nr:D-glycerate dehydrogenase [Anaerolineae bacterium]
MKPKVFVSRRIPDRGLEKVLEFCDAEVWEDELPPSREVLIEKTRDCEGLLSLLTDKIDGEFLDQCPKLRVVANYAVGFDNINVDDCTARGVAVGNTPGVLTDTTADFAFTLLMSAARRVVEGMDYVRAGRWKTWGPMLLLGRDIYGATLGLLGLGRIGSAMAERAKGFNMRVLYYDPYRREDLEKELNLEYVDLDTLFEQADFLSVHVPLTPETNGMVNAARFKQMKKTAILVNSARGPIVNTNDLYEALRDGEIAYAGVDVTDPEPIQTDHPILKLSNFVVCPHIASASIETRGRMAEIAADNLIAGLKGEALPAPVNKGVIAKRK